MFKKIVLGLLLLVAGFLGYVALQPPQFSVTRSLAMAASPADVFAQVNDFHKWQTWSPWAKLDPNAKASFEGPESGKGAIFKWDGNSEVGQGEMEILESKPNEHVVMRLHFVKPMEDTCKTEFMLKPDGEKTLVTWSMSGESNFVGRVFCTFFNMEKMVGEKYDEGLASIQKIVEQPKTP